MDPYEQDYNRSFQLHVMLTEINTLADVRLFAESLVNEGTVFHPDDDFNDHIHIQSQAPAFTRAGAELRNRLMEQCAIVCNENCTDIYDLMREIVLVKTGLDKFFPLPDENRS